MATTPVPVPENVRGLLCAIAYGWTPAPMALGSLETFHYGDADLSDMARAVEFRASRLKVTLGGNDVDRRVPFNMSGHLAGTLVGGARFFADTVLHFGRSSEFSRPAGMNRSVTIEAAEWTVLQGEPPSLWVGRIEGGSRMRHSGNMIVERIGTEPFRFGSAKHLCLEGAYRYYVIQSGARPDIAWHLVVDTAGVGQPKSEALHRDFLALQFVLGRQLSMPTLLGVSDDRRTVACTIGCLARGGLEENAFPPVPVERNNDAWIDESWTAVFFERLSATWVKRPEMNNALWMALEMYLDAMRNHLDADYMRLQVALEAFAYWSLQDQTQEERADVKDKKAWKAWVKANQEAIRQHAVEGREDALYQKVLTTYRLSSGKVVPSAFETRGLPLTSAMASELKGRDTVVHQGQMSPLGYDVDRDIRRVALVRTMLVALLAKMVGYSGAINGWEVGQQGYPLEPADWWAIADGDRECALRTFVAEESESQAPSLDGPVEVDSSPAEGS